MIQQYHLTLDEYPKGFHLITGQIMGKLPELPESGLLNIFIRFAENVLNWRIISDNP